MTSDSVPFDLNPEGLVDGDHDRSVTEIIDREIQIRNEAVPILAGIEVEDQSTDRASTPVPSVPMSGDNGVEISGRGCRFLAHGVHSCR